MQKSLQFVGNIHCLVGVSLSYHLSIVVPQSASPVLRQIVESLFITHAQTNLNSSGRLIDLGTVANTDDNAIKNHNRVWCEGLVRRT